MKDTWTRRELPVLAAAVQHFDDPVAHRFDFDAIVAATGLEETDVQRALLALASADPPYIKGISVAQYRFPIILTAVTERARREVAQWPTPETMADRLIAALSEAAEREPDDEKRSRLRSAAAAMGGVARDVMVQVAGTAITGGM